MSVRCSWLALVLALGGCTCGSEEGARPEGAADESAPPRVADLPPPPELRRAVAHFWVTELVGDDAERSLGRVALLVRGAAPGERPVDATPLGAVVGDDGTFDLLELGDLAPPPFATVTLVGRDRICEVGVERAIDAWQHRRAPVVEASDEATRDELDAPADRAREPDQRVLVLRLAEGCTDVPASAAIAGAPVTRRAIEHAMLTPASADLAGRVHRFERATGAVPTRGPIQSLELAEPGAFVVQVPDLTYVVRNGEVVAVLDGLPFAELTAGSRVFLHAASSLDDYLAPLDGMRAPSAR